MGSLPISSLLPLLLVLVLAFGLDPVHGLRFELESSHTKCISEEIQANAMTVGKYSLVNPSETSPLPDSHKVNVRVIAPNGNKYNYHSADLVSDGKFAFHAVEAGDYITCFTATDHKPATTITVDMEWKTGVAANDWTKVAKKGSVDAMEQELKNLQNAVEDIHSEMVYLRIREEEMQELNKATNSKMAWISFSSLFVCLTVAGVQYMYLKTFFAKKKLI